MRFLISFPLPPVSFHHFGGLPMSGSFMPFCIIIFVVSSLVLFWKESFDVETIRFLRLIQAIALSGGLLEPLVELFGGSIIKGVTLSVCIGVILFLLLTRRRPL